ncbi:MAG: chemotaxis protein CheD [Pirellula sp.]|nr:chemotaxis protein CheD [Pirellula sp.]
MNDGSRQDEGLVGMAQIGVAMERGILRTLLGSCVGVVLYERKIKLLGLAHVVMPDSQGRSQPVGKYADTAIPETIRRMKELSGVSRLTLSAKIAGGANMFAHVIPAPTRPIGDQNMAAIEQILKALDIPIVGRHLGGTAGRRLVVDAGSGTVEVHMIGQPTIRI